MSLETEKELASFLARLYKAVESHNTAPYAACYVLDGFEAGMLAEALKPLLPPKRLARFCIDKTRKNSAGYTYVSFVTKQEGEPDPDPRLTFNCPNMEYVGSWVEIPED
jgi:hypothetical protein